MLKLKRVYKRVQFAYVALKYLYANQSSFRRFLIKSGLGAAFVVILIKLVKRIRKFLFSLTRDDNKTRRRQYITQPSAGGNDVKRSTNPTVNKQFFNELSYLLKLMFPNWLSKQTILLSMHTVTLICRTFLSIYVAKLEGMLVRNIVEKNFKLFWLKLIQWLLIAVPATTCNSLIRYLESRLDLELKTQLIKKYI
jgi:hypothetical protein